MPRDTRLSLWPEQTAYFPLTSSWADKKKKDTLDFSHCTGVHSCGLAASLLNFLSLFSSVEVSSLIKVDKRNMQVPLFGTGSVESDDPYPSDRVLSKSDGKINRIHENHSRRIMADSIALNFFSLIRDYLDNTLVNKYGSDIKFKPIKSNYYADNVLSYPIYRINFSKYDDRRKPLLEFQKYFHNVFSQMRKDYLFEPEDFLAILFEIVKNSADHTSSDAYIGLDFIFKSSSITTCVLIGDLGPGIYEYVRDALVQDRPSRRGKVNFSESYRWALKKGFSTKFDSGRNRGLGIPFIVNRSIALKANLSIFDAKSRLILSSLKPIVEKEPSHNEIWRISHRIDGKKPFFYYLQYEVPIK